MPQAGERLVDVGGGWGSLLFHACEKYGVIGTNVSPTIDQNQWVKEKSLEKGLSGRIFIQEKDFRQITGTFDKYVSLGVFEHAGRGKLRSWIKSMAGCLKQGGPGLLHFIAHDRPMDTDFFIRKHIFFLGVTCPGSAKPSTFIAHSDSKYFSERFRRTWKAYLNFCAEYFRTPNAVLRLYQITFSKGNTTTYPWTGNFYTTISGKRMSWKWLMLLKPLKISLFEI